MTLEPPIRDFITAQRVARLATLDVAGGPHLVPVCFAEVDGRLYSIVDEKPKRTTRLRRLDNIQADARVTLLFDRYDEDWTRLAWVMVRGRARVIDAEATAEYRTALDALRARYEQYRSMSLAGRPVVVVEPERVTSWGLPTS
ncbi:MAG: TIGR03668 family PPOX class F420-dependent oxidoreductase [Dehalococcoidia bacterium]|nr:TIGR03668 family PPOX class F420-dependent oxidoreductase [Dehalococcoidia bacterium]